MANNKILPVTYPPITTFTGYADSLAILFSYEKTYDWIYSHYIQIFFCDKLQREKNDASPMLGACFCDIDSRRIAHIAADFNILKRDGWCPFINTYEIGNDLLLSLGDLFQSFVSFVKHCIDVNMYVYTYLDVGQIKQYNLNGQYDHEVFIYGYDDSEQVFHFADFPNNPANIYNFSKCTYAEIENAFRSINNMVWPPVKSIGCLQYNDILTYNIDMSYIKESIKNYIYPDMKVADGFNNYIMSLFGPLGWQTKIYLGIDTYIYLSKFIDDELRLGSDRIDIRLFHALYDHKEMMIKRLDYLKSKNYLSSKKYTLIEEYSIIKNTANQIRNMVLKYNIKKDTKILTSVQTLLDITKNDEIRVLRGIFEI